MIVDAAGMVLQAPIPDPEGVKMSYPPVAVAVVPSPGAPTATAAAVAVMPTAHSATAAAVAVMPTADTATAEVSAAIATSMT